MLLRAKEFVAMGRGASSFGGLGGHDGGHNTSVCKTRNRIQHVSALLMLVLDSTSNSSDRNEGGREMRVQLANCQRPKVIRCLPREIQ